MEKINNNESSPESELINIQKIFELFRAHMDRVDDLEEAKTDPFAFHLAKEQKSSNQLFEERLLYHHGVMNFLRNVFIDKSAIISSNAQITSEQKVIEVLNKFYENISDEESIKRIFAALKQFLLTLDIPPAFLKIVDHFQTILFDKPWLKSISNEELLLYQKIKPSMEWSDDEEKINLQNKVFEIEDKIERAMNEWGKNEVLPVNRELNKIILQEKCEEHKIIFASLDEATKYERSINIRQKVDTILHLPFESMISYVHEQFTRNYDWDNFQENIKKDILAKKTKLNSNLLQLLEKFILDFINTYQKGYWKNKPEKNFNHDYKNQNLIKFNLENVRSYNNIILDIFENILDEIQNIFLKRKDSFNVSQFKFENKIDISIRFAIIDTYQETLLDKYLAAYEERVKSNVNLTDPFIEEIKKHYGRQVLRDDLNNFRSSQALLEKIELYGFAMIPQAYLDDKGQVISGKSLKQAIYRAAKPFLRNKKFVNKLEPIVSKNVAQRVQEAIAPFIQLINKLVESRTQNINDFKTVLGLGFSGPLFNQENNINQSSDNIIYLAFSDSGNTFEHYVLLDILRNEIQYEINKNTQDNKLKIEIIHPYKFEYQKSNQFDEYERLPADFSIEHDKQVHKYLLARILEFIFLTHSEVIHIEIKQVWMVLINQLIDSELADHKKNKTQNSQNESKLLTNLKKQLTQLPLSEQDFSYLYNLVLGKQTFSCAEILLSRYGHTHIYVPISFHSTHEHIVKNEGEEVYFGKHRPMIEPCFRCQMLSAAYMLWSEMTDRWNLDELQTRAHKDSKMPIPIRRNNIISLSSSPINDSNQLHHVNEIRKNGNNETKTHSNKTPYQITINSASNSKCQQQSKSDPLFDKTANEK